MTYIECVLQWSKIVNYSKNDYLKDMVLLVVSILLCHYYVCAKTLRTNSSFFNDTLVRMDNKTYPPARYNVCEDCKCYVRSEECNSILLTDIGLTIPMYCNKKKEKAHTLTKRTSTKQRHIRY